MSSRPHARIALLAPYFGPWPWWMPLFLATCGHNPSIQWLLFGDHELRYACPENVQFEFMSLSSFNALASTRLGWPQAIKPDYMMKICDLRPAFGAIFADSIDNYDYWGHCDLDVLWGDMDRFLHEALTNEADIITSRSQRITGHFTLFRNTERTNAMYQRMHRFRALASDSTYHSFDEERITRHLKPEQEPSVLTRLGRRFFGPAPENLAIHWLPDVTTAGSEQKRVGSSRDAALRWDAGKAFGLSGNELMYIHFHKLKAGMRAPELPPPANPRRIWVTRDAADCET